MTALFTAFELFKLHWRWLLTIAALCLMSWLWNENTRVTASLDTLQQANDSNRAVMDNVLRTVAITNIALETNQHAKNQTALESQRAQADIKVAVADDDCAARPVPSSAAIRLRQYADNVRSGSVGSTTSESHR